MVLSSGEMTGSEVEYEQMKKFDDYAYLDSVINFIVSHSDRLDTERYEAELWRGYNSKTFGVLAEELTSMCEKVGSLEELLELDGCPQLYQFHKSAKETSSYSGSKLTRVNPFYNSELWVSPDPRTKYIHTGRQDEVEPYVIAIPIEEFAATFGLDDPKIIIGPQRVDMEGLDLLPKLALMESCGYYKVEKSDGRDLNARILEKINGYIEDGLLDP